MAAIRFLYDTVLTIEQSRKGDRGRMRLVSIPHPCPKGDDRGRVYKTTNLRTHQILVAAGFGTHVRRREAGKGCGTLCGFASCPALCRASTP